MCYNARNAGKATTSQWHYGRFCNESTSKKEGGVRAGPSRRGSTSTRKIRKRMIWWLSFHSDSRSLSRSMSRQLKGSCPNFQARSSLAFERDDSTASKPSPDAVKLVAVDAPCRECETPRVFSPLGAQKKCLLPHAGHVRGANVLFGHNYACSGPQATDIYIHVHVHIHIHIHIRVYTHICICI